MIQSKDTEKSRCLAQWEVAATTLIMMAELVQPAFCNNIEQAVAHSRHYQLPTTLFACPIAEDVDVNPEPLNSETLMDCDDIAYSRLQQGYTHPTHTLLFTLSRMSSPFDILDTNCGV